MVSRNSSRARLSRNVFAAAICLFTVLFAGGCAGPPKHPNWSNATGAEQYERLMWKAVREKDWKNFEGHLAPTFVGVNARGEALDRAGWLGYWKAAPVGDYLVGEIAVQPEGADMVVTYPLHISQPGASVDSGSGLRVVSVWQTVKSRWVLISTSVTPVVQ